MIKVPVVDAKTDAGRSNFKFIGWKSFMVAEALVIFRGGQETELLEKSFLNFWIEPEDIYVFRAVGASVDCVW